MSTDTSTHLTHRYAIRLSERQYEELRHAADAWDVAVSVLLRIAIRWVISAGPGIFTRPQASGAPLEPAARFDTCGGASSVNAGRTLR